MLGLTAWCAAVTRFQVGAKGSGAMDGDDGEDYDYHSTGHDDAEDVEYSYSDGEDEAAEVKQVWCS